MYETNAKNNHNVRIYDRNLIELSGINKIISFNNEQFLLDSILGTIDIKGQDLEILQLNTENGNVKIKGTINSLIYFDGKKKEKEDSFLAKIFK